MGMALFMWHTCQTIHRSTFYYPPEVSIRKHINTTATQSHVCQLIEGRREGQREEEERDEDRRKYV